jgi:hypothetical protein
MSTNTINDNKPAATTDPPVASKPVATQTELEARIAARRAELIAKLVHIKTDAGIEAAEARDRLKAKLSQLGHIVKEGVVDGWASLGDVVKLKLDHWLAESGQS